MSGSLSLSIKFTAHCSWEMVVSWSRRVEEVTGGSEQPHKGIKETLLTSFLQLTLPSETTGVSNFRAFLKFSDPEWLAFVGSPNCFHSTKSVFTFPSAFYLQNLFPFLLFSISSFVLLTLLGLCLF